MKRFIILICLLLFCGCNKQTLTSRIAVFNNEEKETSILLLLDDKNRTLKEIEIAYSEDYFVQDYTLYYSKDCVTYNSYDCIKEKKSKTVNIDGGLLLHVFDDGRWVSYSQPTLKIYPNTTVELYLSDCCFIDDCAYLMDSGNNITIYKKNKFISKYYTTSSHFMKLTVIEQKPYLVCDNSIIEITNDGMGFGYYYPINNFEIKRAINNHLYVYQDNEMVVYAISVENHKIKMDVELDERYYNNVVFNEVFKDYYNEGYYIKNYHIFNE